MHNNEPVNLIFILTSKIIKGFTSSLIQICVLTIVDKWCSKSTSFRVVCWAESCVFQSCFDFFHSTTQFLEIPGVIVYHITRKAKQKISKAFSYNLKRLLFYFPCYIYAFLWSMMSENFFFIARTLKVHACSSTGSGTFWHIQATRVESTTFQTAWRHC